MDYKDRQVGLVLFGIVWILLGLLQGGMSLLMIAGTAAQTPGSQPVRIVIPMALLYVATGAAFVTLGIGSIMARRWARALILVSSWMWLITGVLTVGMMFFIVPTMLSNLPAEQAAAKPFIIGCMSVIFGVFFFLLPGLAILFYRSPNVQATVEARDPVRRWTDGVPLPLLAFVLWMLCGASSILLCAFIYPSFPIGPWLVRGVAMFGLMALLATVMFFIGIGAFKRMPAAWWTAMAMLALGVVWIVVLMPKTDFASWYRESGLATAPHQAEMVEALYHGPFFTAWMAVFWAVYLGFLLYLRRYFRPASAA